MAECVDGRQSMKEFSGFDGPDIRCCLCEEEEMLELFREAESRPIEDNRTRELLTIIEESGNPDAVESAEASLFSEMGLKYE